MDVLLWLRRAGQDLALSRVLDFLSDSDVNTLRTASAEGKELVEQWVLPCWREERVARFNFFLHRKRYSFIIFLQ